MHMMIPRPNIVIHADWLFVKTTNLMHYVVLIVSVYIFTYISRLYLLGGGGVFK